MTQLKEKPIIKPFLQNTLNPSELERIADSFVTGWTVKYNTVQTAIAKNKDYQKEEKQEYSKPFVTGWTVKYNTVQTAIAKN